MSPDERESRALRGPAPEARAVRASWTRTSQGRPAVADRRTSEREPRGRGRPARARAVQPSWPRTRESRTASWPVPARVVRPSWTRTETGRASARGQPRRYGAEPHSCGRPPRHSTQPGSSSNSAGEDSPAASRNTIRSRSEWASPKISAPPSRCTLTRRPPLAAGRCTTTSARSTGSRVSLPLRSTPPGPGTRLAGHGQRDGRDGRRERSAGPGCPPSPLCRRGRRRREGVLVLVQGRQLDGVLRLEKQTVVLGHGRRGRRVLNGTCRVAMRRGRHPKPSGVGSRADQRRSCRPMSIGTCYLARYCPLDPIGALRTKGRGARSGVDE